MNIRGEQSDITQRVIGILLTAVGIVAALWAVLDASLGVPAPALMSSFVALVAVPACLVLSRRGHANHARSAFIVIGSLYIAGGELLHPSEAGLDLYWLPAVVFGIIMFRADEVRSIVITMTIILGTMLVTRALHGHVLVGWQPVDYPSATVRHFNFAISNVLIVVFVAAHVHSTRFVKMAQLRDAEAKNDLLRIAFEHAAANEKIVSEVFQAMLEGVRIEDADGRVLKQNQAAMDLLGSDGAERRWRTFDAAGVELGPDAWPPAVVARTGLAQVNVNLRVQRADGSSRYVILTALPLGERSDQVLVTMMDVTEPRKSAELLRQTLNSTPDWIFIKDRAHRYVMVNDAYAAALGRAPADIIGRNDLDLGFPEAYVKGDPGHGIRGFWADDDLVFATGQTQTFDNDPAMIDGVEHTFHTIKAPMFEPGEASARAVIGIARDITQLKTVERQLVTSSKMASLGQMAGGIAHEINNPLAIIGGKAAVLRQQIENGHFERAVADQALRKIQETVDRIAKIIKGLKTYARSGEGDAFLPVALRPLVQEALALCAERSRTMNVAIAATEIEDVAVAGSAAQLSQVLINLLNNAHDAIETFDAKWIRLEVKRLGSDRVEIAVVDSGPGLPSAVLEKLAQPFFTTKAVGRGTGLGLSISKNIMERHGGRLFVDTSAPNTRFVMDLPLAAVDRRTTA